MPRLVVLVTLCSATISCLQVPDRNSAVAVPASQEITLVPEGTVVRVEGFLIRTSGQLQLLRGAPRPQSQMLDIGGSVREVRNWCSGINDHDPILLIDEIDFRRSDVMPHLTSRRGDDFVGQRVVLVGRYKPEERTGSVIVIGGTGTHLETLGTIRQPDLVSVTNDLCFCVEGAEYCN